MDSILKWLVKNGYEYTWNFPLGPKTPDIIAFKEGEVIAFEFKKWASDFSDAVGQCLFYKEKANTTYIVLPLEEIKKIDISKLRLIKKYGIGLIGINKKIQLVVKAKTQNRYIEILLQKLKEKSFARMSLNYPRGSGSEEIRQKILQTIADHPEGLAISHIANITRFHRHTVTRYIENLIGAGVIYQRDLGTVKLHYLSKKLPEKERLLLEKLNSKVAKLAQGDKR